MIKALRRTDAVLFGGYTLIACVVVLVLHACTGCASSQPQPDVAKAAAICISHRTALQLACVDIYQTRPEIDACRASVQRALDCTDGGIEITMSADAGAQ